MKPAAVLAILVLTIAPVVGMADDMSGMNHMDMTKAGPADQAFAQAMQKMMKDMNTKPTGQPDKDFVIMMIPHHQGAIDMAKVELQYGKDPELRKLAADIVKAQEEEIAQMKGWLARNSK